MSAPASLRHSDSEVMSTMTAPQMIAMDKALAEVEIPPPDAGN
jgi:hypothetical protein